MTSRVSPQRAVGLDDGVGSVTIVRALILGQAAFQDRFFTLDSV